MKTLALIEVYGLLDGYDDQQSLRELAKHWSLSGWWNDTAVWDVGEFAEYAQTCAAGSPLGMWADTGLTMPESWVLQDLQRMAAQLHLLDESPDYGGFSCEWEGIAFEAMSTVQAAEWSARNVRAKDGHEVRRIGLEILARGTA